MKAIAGTVKDHLLVAMVLGVFIALADAISVTGHECSDAVPQAAMPGLKKLGRLPMGRQRTEAHFHEKLSDVEVDSINSPPAHSLTQLNVKRRHHS